MINEALLQVAPSVAEAPTPIRREMKIQTLNFGYVVQIDCHSFAVESKETLVKKVSEYFLDPVGVEERWFKTQKI